MSVATKTPRQDEELGILVLCTVPNASVGEAIARGIVEAELAACVNIIPGVRSIYRWQGKVEDDREEQLLIKTRRERFDALCRFIVEQHPYEVPEIIAMPMVMGHAPYLTWLESQTAMRT